jgi:hypothetical protein
MTREEAIAMVLSDPEALWAVCTAKVRVAGPWQKAEKPGYSVHRGEWRCSPSGKDLATIHPWWKGADGLREPQSYDYHMGDEDAFEEDMRKYKVAVARRDGMEWMWRLSLWYGQHPPMYANTREEAKSLADQVLRRKGFLLKDTL